MNRSKIILTSLLLLFFSCMEPNHFTIATRLTVPLINRPISPGQGYIWIEGEWFWNGNSYSWRDGYWSYPANGYRWVPGYWKQRAHGWYWTPGYWKG
jgi:hypothetical protein